MYSVSDCENLRYIVDASDLTYPIARMENCNALTVFGTENGRTAEYCEEKDIPFRILGDSNCDGSVNVSDCIAVAKASMGAFALSETGRMASDVNLDGIVDETDSMLICRYLAQLLSQFDMMK